MPRNNRQFRPAPHRADVVKIDHSDSPYLVAREEGFKAGAVKTREDCREELDAAVAEAIEAAEAKHKAELEAATTKAFEAGRALGRQEATKALNKAKQSNQLSPLSALEIHQDGVEVGRALGFSIAMRKFFGYYHPALICSVNELGFDSELTAHLQKMRINKIGQLVWRKDASLIAGGLFPYEIKIIDRALAALVPPLQRIQALAAAQLGRVAEPLVP